MDFDPKNITDAINQAGAALQERWKNPAGFQMPENDLKPDPAGLDFRIRRLEQQMAELYPLVKKILERLNR